MAVKLSPALLAALFAGYRGEFQKAFQEAKPQWSSVATLVPSTTASNIYAWLGQFPTLREWIGPRVLKEMASGDYTIVNKLFEATVGVPRTAVEDDQAGLFRAMFSEMGRAAAYHPDHLVFSLLSLGFGNKCYDGQNFFDTEHPVYPDVAGEGTPELVSNMDFPSTNEGPTWYLIDDTRALKPIIFQERTKPELESKTNPANSDHVFDHDEYLHGIRYRCNAGFGLWQLAYASRQPLEPEFYGNARAAMQSVKADGGRPLKPNPSTLLVPPQLEAQALRLVAKDENGGNPWAGSAKVMVCTDLVEWRPNP
ncbi:Mu-like prophage major head subunit gpT family protein [Pseudomonas tohonis]|uniref:Mu-like prophage major head subunit gpT family protein n=1 Tax=Pseudomonas tohonis TaxID=2725477 RepID=UPI0022F0469D|nr:Mu-like prophage major head subunit gpT family protein [Pseudomonas tohonis]